MSDLDTPKIEYVLNLSGEYQNTLDIEGFSQMMKDPAYCYKFYWLEALVQILAEGADETTFDAVINEMICNAWYSVMEFHVHLSGMQADGQVRDGLERACLLLEQLSDLQANASKVEIKNAIAKYDAELRNAKTQLTNMVPYRALSGFFRQPERGVEWGSARRMVEYIERVNKEVVLLPYTLGEAPKLKKQIYFQPAWAKMIRINTVSILGWIQYEKVRWLQNNNPEVPGLVYKLAPMDEKQRKLAHVRKLWDGVLDLCPVHDVFNDAPVTPGKYEVDHFIPWSFVMNDELWNLMPMDSSLNSSKSNNLPNWERFFDRFVANQFLLYEKIHEKPGIHKMFEACFRDNLHSIWAVQELYRPGNTREEFDNILAKNMRPVYDSAHRQGYKEWIIA